MHKEVIELFALCDLHILSDFTVTLQDMHIDLTEKILPGLQNIVSLLQKSLHDLTPAGGRGIKSDHEIPDLIESERGHERTL